MIRSTRLALIVFSLVILFILGLDWIFEAAFLEGVFPHVREWPGLKTLPREGRTIIGAAALLLPLAVASLAFAEGALRRGILVAGRNGATVELRPEAIERPVNREISQGVTDVLRVQTLASQSGSGVALDIYATVADDVDVPALQEQIRSAASQTIQRLTGTPPANVRVVVRDVTGRKGAADAKRASGKVTPERRKAILAARARRRAAAAPAED